MPEFPMACLCPALQLAGPTAGGSARAVVQLRGTFGRGPAA